MSESSRGMPDFFTAALEAAITGCSPTLLRPLVGARILITGASGFFGQWVVRAIRHLNQRSFSIRAFCVSRDPSAFTWRNPDISEVSDITWLSGDAANFRHLRIKSDLTHILHMAASSHAKDRPITAEETVRTILEGTEGCIELARRTRAHLHFVSSGAVYGSRRRSDGPAHEDQIVRTAPVPDNSADAAKAYGDAKRTAEAMLARCLDDYSVSRPFAFLGPLLPLDKHFAAGNFVRDAVAYRPILIKGDGTPLRSYLHPADLAIWLLGLLAQAPRQTAINVGSDEPISILELATRVSRIAGSPEPVIAGSGTSTEDPPAYWPDASRARSFGLVRSLDLDRAIQDGLAWARYAVA